MDVARQAGANVRKNAQSMDFGALARAAWQQTQSIAQNALPVIGPLTHAIPAARDFSAGVAGAPPAKAATPIVAAAQVQKPKAAASKANAFREGVLGLAPKASGGGVLSLVPQSGANAAAGPPDFTQMAAAVAASNGGKISLRELAALSDITAKTAASSRQVKPPTAKDLGMQEYLKIATALSQHELAQAQKAGDQEGYLSASHRALQRLAPYVNADQYAIPQLPGEIE